MSLDGHPAALIGTFPMPRGTSFAKHAHDEHQLAWARRGILTVQAGGQTWVLPPTRGLWLPALLPHVVRAHGAAVMRSVYLRPETHPALWPEPTAVVVSGLLAELVDHLAEATLDADARLRAEAVLVDQLVPAPAVCLAVPAPSDPRAAFVAQALRRSPADCRTLQEWGRATSTSARTLARGFDDGSGMTFGRWRTRTRLHASLLHLAAGEPVSRVARRIGFDTTSAFVAAFRRETGTTPGAYFQHPRPRRPRAGDAALDL